jgi:uncharacterized protein YcaQ
MTETLTPGAARRIALAAQGFGKPPAAATGWRPIGQALGRIGLLQIDSVNVLARAHYLPLFSRLGPYPRETLEAAAWGRPRRLFEYWAHEASLLPLELHPLLRWRMARAEGGEGTWSRMKAYAGERRAVADALLRRIETDGPLAASDLGGAGEGGWWGWSEAKTALEWLFYAGRITARTRRGSFERVYDLTERVIPARILQLPTPDEPEAQRQLMAVAARAMGIATATDLRDYFRLRPADAAARLAELREDGELVPVQVRGWPQGAYLHREARRPRRMDACALLAPFDPLVWERGRTERLFGMRYRIGIYTPADKREHGYYVLPFLLGDALVARVDLKADRAGRALVVQSAHAEPGAPPHLAEPLAHELARMAGWLGLGQVRIAGLGPLSDALRAETVTL